MSLAQPVTESPGRFVLTTFGEASLAGVTADGPKTLLGPGKPLALLAYLSTSPGSTASRDHLVDLFWADLDPGGARHALRQTLWYLKQRLGDDGLAGDANRVTLHATIQSDRESFLTAVQKQQFEQAVEIYRGDFLPGFALPGAADFEQWADVERYRLRRLFERAAESLIRDLLSRNEVRRASQLARRARDLNADHEPAWRHYLETLLAAKDRVAAELEAALLEQRLAADERAPEPATRVVLDAIRATPWDLGERSSKRALAAELIGREKEFASILAAWKATAAGSGRHVQVIGAAGLGKTRLLNDVGSRIRASGSRAVIVRANPGERAVPYALASDIAAALANLRGALAVSPASASALVALNPTLSSLYHAVPDRSSDLEALRRREIALAELLSAVADEQAVALFIDDLHWADGTSQQLVASLIGKLAEGRVMIVTTARPTPDDATLGVPGERITLRPLSTEETEALVASIGALPNEPWAAGFSAAVHGSSLGVPLLVLESLRALLELELLSLVNGVWECGDGPALAAELRRGGALRRRIEDLPHEQRSMLLLLAAAGAPIGCDLLVAAAASDGATVRATLSALEFRGLAVHTGPDWEPAHDEIAARAIELADDDLVQKAHGALGRALGAASGDDTHKLHRAGRHLGAAGEIDALKLIYARWVLILRRNGDRRDATQLAKELLGDTAAPAHISSVAKSLPLYIRAGLFSRHRLAAAAVAILLLGGASGAAMLRPRPPIADVTLVAVGATHGQRQAFAIPLRREAWTTVEPLEATEGSRIRVPSAAAEKRGDMRISPVGHTWAFSQVMPDSGEIDLFLVDDQGRETRLTSTPGDDAGPGWSPDGRLLAFQTTRGDPNRWGDLAVIDPATGLIRQLTRGDDTEGNPQWSPDGTRIAFERKRRSYETRRTDDVCWTTPDARAESCIATPLLAIAALVGWFDARHLLVQIDSAGQMLLARLSVDTRELEIVARGLDGEFQRSANGGWIICLCRRGGTGRPTWMVFPLDWPEGARRVRFGSANRSDVTLQWGKTGKGKRYLDRLEILSASDTIPLSAPYKLHARGLDGNGNETDVLRLSWSSSDPKIAAISESTGVILPRLAGEVVIRASAGGWREAERRFVLHSREATTVLAEDWARGISNTWVVFGDPAPTIVNGPQDVPAFWNRGDGWFWSGAYTRRAFSAANGLGVEARWSSPVVGPRQQLLNLGFKLPVDSTTFTADDHRTGQLSRFLSGCTVAYPIGDEVPRRPALLLGSREILLDPNVNSGAWYTVRLQIFADGRCGVAVDGKPLWISDQFFSTDQTYQIIVWGNSLGNRMLVGPLEAWQGVRGGVAWSQLEPTKTGR